MSSCKVLLWDRGHQRGLLLQVPDVGPQGQMKGRMKSKHNWKRAAKWAWCNRQKRGRPNHRAGAQAESRQWSGRISLRFRSMSHSSEGRIKDHRRGSAAWVMAADVAPKTIAVALRWDSQQMFLCLAVFLESLICQSSKCDIFAGVRRSVVSINLKIIKPIFFI